MENSAPLPLGEVLDSLSTEVWNAVARLPQMRDLLSYDDDEKKPIVTIPSEEDLLKVREQAVPGLAHPIEDVVRETESIYAYRVHVNHPRFFMAIPSPAISTSWLGDLLSSSFNVFTGAWQAAPAVATIEKTMIAWLATQLGLPLSAGGTFVSGGTMATLTALVVARDQRLSDDDLTRGVAYFSDQTHFCVPKALGVLGIRKSQMRSIATDSGFRIDMVELKKAITEDKAKGLIPFLIIANAATVNTGAIDPINEIADLAQEHGIWLHVDGAIGASVALSKSYKYLLSGIERADSVAWDAHKWLFQTFGCAVVLVRDKAHLVESFTANGAYFRDVMDSDDEPNFWHYGLELTRPARHMRLWFSLRVLGLDTFGRMIDHGFILAATVETELKKLPGWQITSPASICIITFRYCPEGMTDDVADKVNSAISLGLIESSIAYIVTTELRGRVNIRICCMNPRTTIKDMQEVVAKLHSIACQLPPDQIAVTDI